MTTEEMRALVEAALAGRTLQQNVCGRWEDWDGHPFNFGMSLYRIKPAERKPREWTLILDGKGDVLGGGDKYHSVVKIPDGTSMAELQRVRVREVIE